MIDEISFQNVDFGYDPRVLVLRNISFTLPHDRKLAIVGRTGAGKSTIVNLLARFYDPTAGRICVNGHDLRDIAISSLRKRLGIVLQDSFLFPLSVRENIRIGNQGASDEEIVQAARSVGAHQFITRLPRGYDFMIQESSSNISIGQRQLISFARTLLSNPEILVLDEATSSVDPYTELVIQTALTKLLKNRMTLIVAHRLSTIKLCDEILVLENGQIVEKGSHNDLMEKEGLYSSFYKLQFREETGLEGHP